MDDLRYVFTELLDGVTTKCLLDIGSRTGAVLYAVCPSLVLRICTCTPNQYDPHLSCWILGRQLHTNCLLCWLKEWCCVANPDCIIDSVLE